MLGLPLSTQSQDNGRPASKLSAPDRQLLERIDRLDQMCKASPKEVAPQVKLWEAVASLPYWICINRGTPQAPRPFMLAGQSGPILCVFTTPQRARQAALSVGIIQEGDPLILFAPPLPGAMDWAMSFEKYGVTGLTIDYPRIGVWSSLTNLAHLKPSRPPR